MSRDPDILSIDTGYLDPLDPRDVVHEDRDDRPDLTEIGELDSEQLERELAFGGDKQFLAREELERRTNPS